MRENLVSNIFVTDVASGVKQGSRESEFIKDMARNERSFSFVSFPFSTFPDGRGTQVWRGQQVPFREGEGEPHPREVQRIRGGADPRRRSWTRPARFEELAKTHSKDPYADKGGDMGWRYAYDLEGDFETKDTAQKVLALKAGELSDVLKGTFGWMIYRCDGEAVDADFTPPGGAG